MQREAACVTVRESIIDYISRLSIASREHEMVEVGISPRGALFLNRLAKARAYTEDRDYVTAADVQAVFADVCAHRILLSRRAYAQSGTVDQVLADILRSVEVPDLRALQ